MRIILGFQSIPQEYYGITGSPKLEIHLMLSILQIHPFLASNSHVCVKKDQTVTVVITTVFAIMNPDDNGRGSCFPLLAVSMLVQVKFCSFFVTSYTNG